MYKELVLIDVNTWSVGLFDTSSYGNYNE